MQGEMHEYQEKAIASGHLYQEGLFLWNPQSFYST
jgi:hypothetical protein